MRHPSVHEDKLVTNLLTDQVPKNFRLYLSIKTTTLITLIVLATQLTTREAAALIGVHESSVKRWCDAGTLTCLRTSGGHRRIPMDALLAFAEREGIACPLLAFHPEEEVVWKALSSARDKRDYARVVDLTYEWLRTGNDYLPIRLFQFLDESGIHACTLFDQIVRSVMYRVGAAWKEGSLRIGDEHRITNVVLDGLQALRPYLHIDPRASDRQEPVAIVGCAEGNLHEMGAHMIRMLLQKAGWRVVYLGASVPVEDLAIQQAEQAAELVCISFCAPQVASDVLRTLDILSRYYSAEAPYSVITGGSLASDDPELTRSKDPFKMVRFFTGTEPFYQWVEPLSHS